MITLPQRSLDDNQRQISREEGERARALQLGKNAAWKNRNLNRRSAGYRFDPESDDEYDAWKDGEVDQNGVSFKAHRAGLKNPGNWDRRF